MTFILAHKDDCDIVLKGPTLSFPIDADVVQDVATPCSCGGVKIDLKDLLPTVEVVAHR